MRGKKAKALRKKYLHEGSSLKERCRTRRMTVPELDNSGRPLKNADGMYVNKIVNVTRTQAIWEGGRKAYQNAKGGL